MWFGGCYSGFCLDILNIFLNIIEIKFKEMWIFFKTFGSNVLNQEVRVCIGEIILLKDWKYTYDGKEKQSQS